MNQDPFDVLGLPASFEVDAGRIEAAYLSRAAALHPDVSGDAHESTDLAAILNRAKAILDHPEKRAEALLTRIGGPAKEADKSLPAGFLMSILEVREQVEAAAASRDPAAVGQWSAWAQGQRAQYSRIVGELFTSFHKAPQPAMLAGIRRELNAWRYIERLIEQLEPDYDPNTSDFQG